MLQNHFVKLRLGASKKLPNPNFSMIFNCLSNDKLYTYNDMMNTIMSFKEVRDTFWDKVNVRPTLDELISQGFIKEIAGAVLESKLGL